VAGARKKRSPGLRVVWITGRRGHRRLRHHGGSHQYNKWEEEHSPRRSIMSGDSPDEPEYQYSGRSTPPPTTSYLHHGHSHNKPPSPLVPRNVNKEDEKSDVIKEQEDKDKDKDKEMKDHDKDDIDSSTIRTSDKKDDKGRADDGSKDSDDKNKEKLSNGLDAKWHPPPEAPPEERDCVVDCLYYTLQCCECTIM